MIDDDGIYPRALSRRAFLRAMSAAGIAAAALPVLDPGRAFGGQAGPTLLRQPAVTGAPNPEQVHVQFGADASREAAVSWATPQAVVAPRLRLGTPGAGLGRQIDAEERVYTEALTGQTVFTYHARIDRLRTDTNYI